MIQAKPKPLNEIAGYIAPYQRVLILGCGSYVLPDRRKSKASKPI